MMTQTKRIGTLLLLLIATAALGSTAIAAPATLHKNPSCLCCEKYAHYLEQHGFDIKVIGTDTLAQFKRDHAVPASMHSCHTVLIDGYVVEGHVPVDAIKRMLREQPPIAGISLPGMPAGSPGMGGAKQAPFVIYAFADGQAVLYATQ